jgi:hypothetical protein
MQFRALAGPGVGRMPAEAITNCLPWGKPVRVRLTGLVLLAVLGVTAARDAAWAQVPGVGPGHCVSGCGGGSSSLGRGGGGSRGGGMGAGAIGAAIGIGVAIGSAAAQQQQQQQAKEKSGARKEESARRVSHAREAKPERHKTDQADKPKEAAKQPQDTKQTKLTQPAKNSNWSGCTGKVGTTWNAGNCGHPTMSSSGPQQALANSSAPGSASYDTSLLHSIPDVSRILNTALPCPKGYTQIGVTFYGGTKCSLTQTPQIQSPENADTAAAPKPPPANVKNAYPVAPLLREPEKEQVSPQVLEGALIENQRAQVLAEITNGILQRAAEEDLRRQVTDELEADLRKTPLERAIEKAEDRQINEMIRAR